MSYYDKYIKYKTKYNKLQKVLKGGYDNLNLAAIFNYKYYSFKVKKTCFHYFLIWSDFKNRNFYF